MKKIRRKSFQRGSETDIKIISKRLSSTEKVTESFKIKCSERDIRIGSNRSTGIMLMLIYFWYTEKGLQMNLDRKFSTT